MPEEPFVVVNKYISHDTLPETKSTVFAAKQVRKQLVCIPPSLPPVPPPPRSTDILEGQKENQGHWMDSIEKRDISTCLYCDCVNTPRAGLPVVIWSVIQKNLGQVTSFALFNHSTMSSGHAFCLLERVQHERSEWHAAITGMSLHTREG